MMYARSDYTRSAPSPRNLVGLHSCRDVVAAALRRANVSTSVCDLFLNLKFRKDLSELAFGNTRALHLHGR
jgi:hypothetical protein